MKLRLYDGTNYFVYTTIIQIMSRKIWKHCNNSRWRVNSIKNLYANWRIYLAEEWHVVLYVFNGKLVFIKITSVTFIMIYSDCKSIQCYPLLAAECANFSIGHYRNPPDPFENIAHFLGARFVYSLCSHCHYNEEAMDFVNDDAGRHMLKTDAQHSSIWYDSALSIFYSSMSIVDPLKYDRELNYSFLESLKIH